MFFWDPTYILVIPALIFALFAQARVKSVYEKFKQIPSRTRISGAQVAASILSNQGIGEVAVVETEGFLADHYDPQKKTVNLSSEVYHGDSIASLAVAAHECGHALQHANHYVPLNLRSDFLPLANIGSFAAFPLFFIGFLFHQGFLLNLGIFLFFGAVLFHLITLPVEFNASSRALKILEHSSYLDTEELTGAKKVLNAAALTYVASAAMALVELLRLLILRNMIEGGE